MGHKGRRETEMNGQKTSRSSVGKLCTERGWGMEAQQRELEEQKREQEDGHQEGSGSST